MSLTLTLTLTLIIVAMNLIKAQQSAKTKWFCPFMNINDWLSLSLRIANERPLVQSAVQWED